MRTVCKFMSRAKKRQMQKKIRKVNQVLAESLMSLFVFLVLIFSFLYRAYTYSLFFVYWRVSFTLFTFSIAHSMVIGGNITWLSVSGLFDHSCGDGVQHMADSQNLQDRHRKPEAASYQVLHYSWRYVSGAISNLKIPNSMVVLSKFLVPRQFAKGCPITN